jgi:hypothetical protein
MQIDWNKRELLLGALGLLVPPFCCSGAAHAQTYSGCWLTNGRISNPQNSRGAKSEEGLEDLTSQSSDPSMDLALRQSLNHLYQLFRVRPGFSFFRETGSPNAKATNQPLMDGRPEGTVLLGLKLVDELLKLPYPAVGIVAVCAHEYAHILSYSNGMYAQLAPAGASPFRAEQFADFMAGYYAGVRKKQDANFPAVMFAATTSLYGGGEHGTPEQRGAAINAGFNRAFYANDETVVAARQAFDYAMAQPG